MRLCVLAAIGVLLLGCKAREDATGLESSAIKGLKEISIGGEDWENPVPDTEQAAQEGASHFQHHCQVCHGLDGQNTGVPFAGKMDPPVADLASQHVQSYADGQLKWIIENGIRYSGMPAWSGIIEEEEMWKIVRYLRRLPSKGSLGAPKVYTESSSAHTHAEGQQE